MKLYVALVVNLAKVNIGKATLAVDHTSVVKINAFSGALYRCYLPF